MKKGQLSLLTSSLLLLTSKFSGAFPVKSEEEISKNSRWLRSREFLVDPRGIEPLSENLLI